MEVPDESGAEDGAGDHDAGMLVRSQDGAGRYDSHDDCGHGPEDQRYGLAALVDPEPGRYGAAQPVAGQRQRGAAQLR